MYQMKVGDEVTVSAVIVGISEAGNPIIQFPCGVKCLVKASDIKTICPKIEKPKEDKRKGK